jgi:hypothetical protein
VIRKSFTTSDPQLCSSPSITLILIAADATFFATIACENGDGLNRLGVGASTAVGVTVVCKGRFFRHGHPDEQYWLWFESSGTARQRP